jgi:hypothetical protein
MQEEDHAVFLQRRLEVCAKAAHEVNRAYCAVIGAYTQPEWEDAPDRQKKITIKLARGVVASGLHYSPRHVHERWMDAKQLDDWSFGEARDPERRTHPCMVDYSLLPEEHRAKGSIFINVVRQVWEALRQQQIHDEAFGGRLSIPPQPLSGSVFFLAESGKPLDPDE